MIVAPPPVPPGLETLAKLVDLLADPAGVQAAIAALREAAADANEAHARATAALKEAQATAERTAADLAVAERLRGEVTDKERALAEWEATLKQRSRDADVAAARRADADQQRELQLTEREVAVAAREARIGQREDTAAERQAEADALIADYQDKLGRMRAIAGA